MNTRDCDVLIIGGGLAGLQAAVTLAEKAPEKKVLIADLGGGASSEIMGFCAPLEPDDSPEIFMEDTLRVGAGENDPALVKRLCYDAAGMVKYLEKLGVEFDRRDDGSYDLLRPVGSSFPRVVHHKTTTGKVVMEKYRELLRKSLCVEFHKTRIVKLFTENGAICGALGFQNGEPTAYNTSCIILATGGAAGLYGFSSWTKILQGSGYALALDAGAELTGMRRMQFEPCVTVWPEKFYGFPIITTLLFEGAKLLDRNGNSLLPSSVPAPAKRELAKLIADCIDSGNGSEHGGVHFNFSGVDETAFMKEYPEYYRKLRPLASDYKDLRVEVKPAAHTTLGGVKINANAATAVSGLFAAGEVTGGIHGRDRIGGNAGLEVLVFGLSAGLSAAAFAGSARNAENCCEEFIRNIKCGNGDLQGYINGTGILMDKYCGINSFEQNMAKGRECLRSLADSIENNPPSAPEQVMKLRHAITTAKILFD